MCFCDTYQCSEANSFSCIVNQICQLQLKPHKWHPINGNVQAFLLLASQEAQISLQEEAKELRQEGNNAGFEDLQWLSLEFGKQKSCFFTSIWHNNYNKDNKEPMCGHCQNKVFENNVSASFHNHWHLQCNHARCSCYSVKEEVTNITQLHCRKKQNSKHNGQYEPKYYTFIDMEAVFTCLFEEQPPIEKML